MAEIEKLNIDSIIARLLEGICFVITNYDSILKLIFFLF